MKWAVRVVAAMLLATVGVLAGILIRGKAPATEPNAITATTVAKAPLVGTAQTLYGSAPGEEVSAVPSDIGPDPFASGGVMMTFKMTNLGQGDLSSELAAQVAVEDTSGKTWIATQSTEPSQGGALTLPPRIGQIAVLDVPMAPRATPALVLYSPFGNSGPGLRWTVSR